MSDAFDIASVPRGTHQMFKLSPVSSKATNQFTRTPGVCNSSFDLQTWVIPRRLCLRPMRRLIEIQHDVDQTSPYPDTS